MVRTAAISTPATIEPLAVGAEDAARLCGVGRSKWWEMHRGGRCPAGFKLDSKRLWLVEELRAWLLAGVPRREDWKYRPTR